VRYGYFFSAEFLEQFTVGPRMEFSVLRSMDTLYLRENIPFCLRSLNQIWTIYVPRRVGRIP
jgi:hypothetical protein